LAQPFIIGKLTVKTPIFTVIPFW